MVVLVRAGWREPIIDGIWHYSGLPLCGELRSHVSTEHIDGGYQAWVDVALDGIDVRREIDTSASSTHLVDIVHYLWVPEIVGP